MASDALSYFSFTKSLARPKRDDASASAPSPLPLACPVVSSMMRTSFERGSVVVAKECRQTAAQCCRIAAMDVRLKNVSHVYDASDESAAVHVLGDGSFT